MLTQREIDDWYGLKTIQESPTPTMSFFEHMCRMYTWWFTMMSKFIVKPN